MSESSSADFIYSENQEVSVGEMPGWSEKIFSAFPAFKSKNYQYYFIGQLVSLVGTWLQIVAEGWLVLQLTNSAFWVGLVAACATVPTLLFSLFGGVIVDRFEKKRILVFTQYSAMILALLYGLLTVFHLINIVEIMVLAFLLGVVTALDIPARQAFVVEMVGKENIASAVALNSGMFNGARVIGPGLAGILIALVGSGGAFILNGLSYIAAIIALSLMRVQPHPTQVHDSPFAAIKAGVSYAFSHPVIRMMLLFTGIVSIFGWSYSTIMPVIAKNVFGLNAAGLGYLYAASGLGALTGTILLSSLSKKFGTLFFILGGNSLFALAIIVFSLVHNVALAYVFLFLAGIGLVVQFATINTAIQHMVDNNMRGRVMSIYSLAFLGLAPLGNFEIGWVAEHFGVGRAIQIGASLVFLFGVYLFFQRKNIRKEYHEYTNGTS